MTLILIIYFIIALSVFIHWTTSSPAHRPLAANYVSGRFMMSLFWPVVFISNLIGNLNKK